MSLSGPAFRSSLRRHRAAFFLMIGRTAPLVYKAPQAAAQHQHNSITGRLQWQQAWHVGLAALCSTNNYLQVLQLIARYLLGVS